jgi:hypothetical protein
MKTNESFVKSIAHPALVLSEIDKGHTAVKEAGNNPLAIGAAVAVTWASLAEIEGDYVATQICNNVWPQTTELAAAA